jgi:hypothetical protein
LEVLLEDMRTEHTPFPVYYHRYKLIYGKTADSLAVMTTDWTRVSGKIHRREADFLGMSLYSRVDGKENSTPHPPGYDYVGNERYGRWRTDEHGNRFWEFYGKFMFFNMLFNLGTRSLYYRDYDRYRTYRQTRKPFFGAHREYGTRGTLTRRTHSSFYRRTSGMGRSSGFRSRVSRRLGRSRSGFTSRGGGFGK